MTWQEKYDEHARKRDQDRAEDLGLSGFDFIGRQEDTIVRQALSIILSRKMYDAFVSPEQIQNLHPSITPDTSESYARQLSLQLIQITIGERSDCPVKDLRADMNQILSGAAVGTFEGLVMLCLAVGETSESILLRAQALSPYEVESILGTNISEDSPPLVSENPVGFHPRSKLLADEESMPTLQALGRLLTEKLYEEFVTPSAIQQLHDKIPHQMSRGTAHELSMTLLSERLRTIVNGPRIDHSALTQVLGGTLMAQSHAFKAICQALGVNEQDILCDARKDSGEPKFGSEKTSRR